MTHVVRHVVAMGAGVNRRHPCEFRIDRGHPGRHSNDDQHVLEVMRVREVERNRDHSSSGTVWVAEVVQKVLDDNAPLLDAAPQPHDTVVDDGLTELLLARQLEVSLRPRSDRLHT